MEAVEERVNTAWPDCKSGEEKWTAITTAFTEAGRTTLGIVRSATLIGSGNMQALLLQLLFTETSCTISGSPCTTPDGSEEVQGG